MNHDELKNIRLKLGLGKWSMAAKLCCEKRVYCNYEEGRYKIPAQICYLAMELEKNTPVKAISNAPKHNGRSAFLKGLELGCQVTVSASELNKYRNMAKKLDPSIYKFSMKLKDHDFAIIKRLYY